jgi:hypothetical protein
MYLEELLLNIKITAKGRVELERLDFDIYNAAIDHAGVF